MTVTQNTVAKGAGAVGIRRISDSRLLYLNTNSKYTLNKSTTEGEKVTGFTSDGSEVDLDVAGSTETYELEIASKKNTRNINELVMDSNYTAKASYNAPWIESATVASGTVTLQGGTPVAGTLVVSYMDGDKLTLNAGAPATGEYKDNGDGTITFNAAQNGKIVVCYYRTTLSNVFTQGGADHEALGYLDVMFHQVSGSSTVNGKKGVDIIWLPKCSLSGESSLEFSKDVQDKTFKLTGLIPDTPAGFKKPYVIIRNAEVNNTNAG